MQKIIIFFLVVIFSHAARTEWSLHSDYGDLLTYFDFDTAAVSGDKVLIWRLDDFINPQEGEGYVFRSAIAIIEINCATKEYRNRAGALFSENMPRERALYAWFDSSLPWQPAKSNLKKKESEMVCNHERVKGT
jgi:hypothetical protein